MLTIFKRVNFTFALSVAKDNTYDKIILGIDPGTNISGYGVKVDTYKAEVISKLSIPNCQKDVKSFIGFTGIIEDL